ncbi:hypothetical protein VPHD51_0176 [Vibrio phage D51]
MRKIMIVTLALLLSGCYIYPSTIAEAQSFCSQHGGLKHIRSNSWTDQETITCNEEGVSKIVKDQRK